MDQSALLKVLEAFKIAEVGDRVCTAAETVYRALIEAVLTLQASKAPNLWAIAAIHWASYNDVAAELGRNSSATMTILPTRSAASRSGVN